MYVSIDMDKLEFLHKHHSHDTLSALAWLEAPDRSVTIESTDREFFLHNMSGLDLRMLYKNTTAEDVTGTPHLILREMLATLVEVSLDATLAIEAEVLAQVEAVEDDLQNGIPWKYAIGSKRPAKQDQLFSLHCKPLAPEQNTIAVQRAPQRRKVAPAAPVRATPASAAVPAMRKPRASAGSIRPKIWATADRMWEAAGKPMDKTVVLALRKEMMVVLETEGVKRTSSSNELGNWMKDRLGAN